AVFHVRTGYCKNTDRPAARTDLCARHRIGRSIASGVGPMPEQQEQLSPQTLHGAKVKAEFAPAVDAAAPIAPETQGAAEEQVPPGSKWKRLWKEQVRPLAIMLLVLFSVRSSIADWNVVP